MPVTDPEVWVLAVVVAAFFTGGLVKGVSGVGLPMVALPILSFAVSVPTAAALTMAPIIVSNGWQAMTNGALRIVVRRFWPLQLTMAISLLLSASLLVRVDNSTLLILAGLILIASIVVLTLAKGYKLPPHLELPAGIATGVGAGALGGVRSRFGIPIIIYLSSLGLGRTEFLTAISVVYFFGAVPYVAGLLIFGAVTPPVMAASLLAVIPAMIGLMLAARMIRGIDDSRFRNILNAILILLGFAMIVRGVAGA